MKKVFAAFLLIAGIALVNSTSAAQTNRNAEVRDASSVSDLVKAVDFNGKSHSEVLRLYQAIFNRPPDLAGAKYWIGINNQGYGVLAIAGFMSGSQEWRNAYAGSSDAEFVEIVYSNVLGRTYDQAGYEYWLDVVRGTNTTGKNPALTRVNPHEMVFYVTANDEFKLRYPIAAGSADASCAGATRTEMVTLLAIQSDTVRGADSAFPQGRGTRYTDEPVLQVAYLMSRDEAQSARSLVELSDGTCWWMFRDEIKTTRDAYGNQFSDRVCADAPGDIRDTPSESSPTFGLEGPLDRCSFTTAYPILATKRANQQGWTELTYNDLLESETYRAWVRIDRLRFQEFDRCQFGVPCF